MTNEEIRERINQNNLQIEAYMNSSCFVLDDRIRDLLEENKKLREMCNHTFENKSCIYCDTPEEE